MNTRLHDIAFQISETGRGDLPYAGGDREEVLVCSSAIRELQAIESAAMTLRLQLEQRRSEFESIIKFSQEVSK